MAKIHENLIFDHLYFTANEEEFEEIRKIFLNFQCASHQIVKADDSTWEGLYIRTRGQNYFEVLKDSKANGIGLCQKAFGQLSQDARHITNDFPNLPWKTFERTISGRKWFTALACDNYYDLQTPFNTWVMHYHQRDDEKTYPLPKFEITQMTEIYFSAHPSLIDKVKLNSTWFNAEKEITDKYAIFNLQTYYSDLLKMHISFDNKDIGIKFKKACLKLENEITFKNFDLKYFKATVINDCLVLEKK